MIIIQGKVRTTRRDVVLFALLSLFRLVFLKPAGASDSDPEAYKFKFDAQGWIAKPGGSLQGNTGPIDFQKDFNFGSYSTFYGLLEWKPGRKHHIYCYIAPNQSSVDHVLARQIEFEGTTFFAKEKLHTELKSFIFSPGYEYDFISRSRGHLGIEFTVNLFDSRASIQTQGGVIGPGGTVTIARSASKSLFVPLPTGGPAFRYYLVPSRLYVDGAISGMYLFGYGNFISTTAF